MKTKLPLIAALYCGLSAVGSAFTLDFSGLAVGVGLPQTINVSGYGDVRFENNIGALEIGTFAPGATKAISFDQGESIVVTFLGLTPVNVQMQYIGVDAGENFTFSNTADPKVFITTMTSASPSAQAGLQSVVFDQVPEPSAALLGVFGTSLLVLRRRR